MSNAICTVCGKEKHWHARRGSRLADLRCECGGKLKAKRDGEYSGLRPSGYKMLTCAICGAKHRAENLLVVPREGLFSNRVREERKELPAGAFICRHHCIVDRSDDFVSTTYWERPPEPE